MKSTIYVKKIRHSDEQEDHKYIARVETGNPEYKYRYFYSNEAYQAYLNGLKKTTELNSVAEPAQTTPTTGSLSSFFSSLVKSIEDKYNDVKVTVKNTFDDVERYIFKGQEKVGATVANEVTADEVKKKINYKTDIVDLGKSFVSNILKGFAGTEMKPYDKIDSMDELPKKIDDYTDEEDQAVINPDYDPDSYAYSMNCAYCTAAYELRQRGYDVEAAPANQFTANTLEEIESWYKGAESVGFETVDIDTYERTESAKGAEVAFAEAEKKAAKAVEQQLRECGDGARGQFLLHWYGGGGHSMVWEVEGNDVVVRDSQTNEIVDMTEYFGYANSGYYIRTDNVELSDNILKAVRQRY